MKKVLLTLALAAFAFAANAQFVVSGQLGFNTNGGSTYTKTEVGVTNETKIPNNILNTITFAPSFGYMLNDNMQVGLSFGLGYRYTKTFNTVPPIGEAYTTPNLNAENWTSVSQMNFNIAPYFRYVLLLDVPLLTPLIEAPMSPLPLILPSTNTLRLIWPLVLTLFLV